MTAQVEQFPAAEGESAERVEQRLVGGGKVELAGRVDVLEGPFVPLRRVADDARLAGGKGREVDLGRRQDVRRRAAGNQRQIEFASLDELLGKALPAELPRARFDLTRRPCSRRRSRTIA